jgi:hypothetical protein
MDPDGALLPCTPPHAEPALALEAARTLEYITLGSSSAAQLEADTARALVSLLHSRGSPRGGGSAAAAALGAAAAVPASVVKEASDVLQQVIQAAASALAAPAPALIPPSKAAKAAPVAGPAAVRSGIVSVGTLVPAPGAPASSATAAMPGGYPEAAMQMLRPLPASFTTQLPADGGQSSPQHERLETSAFPGTPPSVVPTVSTRLGANGAPPPPAAAAGSRQGSQQQHWQQLVGRSAPSFQAVASLISEGPWKAVKMQVRCRRALHSTALMGAFSSVREDRCALFTHMM